jgi:hypothetical protein
MSGILDTRYEINGVIDTNKSVLSNIESLCTAAGTWLTYDNHEGKWSFVINKAGASVASFDDSNIIGPITVNGTGLTELYNSVKFEFPHIDINDQKDYIQIDIPAVDRNSNEPDNTLNLQTEIINDPIQAELIALMELKQSRVDSIINFTTDWSMIGLKAGDIIDVTNSYYGYANKKFRIVTIQEVDQDDGRLDINITALEYDENVYSTEDLSRYTVSNSTGIVTIGAIGNPGTPTITVYNNDPRPRIVATSTAPTGIVEGLEFWYTSDVPPGVIIDANRTYKLLDTIRPKVGNVFAYGDTIIMDYDSLDSGNFLIKTRGINKGTSGPFSTPAGFVYNPLQTAGAIGSSTVASDGTGLLTTLSVLSLLSKTDGLFSGDSAVGGLFDKMFSVFKDATGYDLKGDSGNLKAVTTGNVSSINKTITSGNFTANIGAGPSAVLLNTITFTTSAGSGIHSVRIFQDVNHSGCVGGRGSEFSEHSDISALSFDLYKGNTLVTSTSTGGPGVIYWQDFTLEKDVTLTGYSTYDLKIYAAHNPGRYTTDYQTSEVTYTVTKFG